MNWCSYPTLLPGHDRAPFSRAPLIDIRVLPDSSRAQVAGSSSWFGAVERMGAGSGCLGELAERALNLRIARLAAGQTSLAEPARNLGQGARLRNA